MGDSVDIESLSLNVGDVLGIRLQIASKDTDVYWKIQGKEFGDYHHSFGSIAANTASGWIDIQTAQNVRVLEPRSTSLVHQFFAGIAPSTGLLFYQYPINTDRNAIVGNRLVDENGQGGVRGMQSPYHSPSPKTEFWTLQGLYPALNLFNSNDAAYTCRVALYAYMYRVEGPFEAREIGGEDRIEEMLDRKRGRRVSIYGVTPIGAPTWVDEKWNRKLPDVGSAMNGAQANFAGLRGRSR